MGSEPTPVPLGEWLDRVRALISPGGELPLSDDEQRILLELARVAAHTSERVAAPLTTYLAGVALARLPAEERAAELQRVLDALAR